MADRQRQTNRVNFRGLSTRLLPDATPVGKYPVAINVCADGDSKIKTRPGMVKSFNGRTIGVDSGSGKFITDINSYATLGTESRPRVIVHDSGGGVWLDDGMKKGQVGVGGIGASLIPFRPSSSPQSFMYIGNPTGYVKFSAPNSSNTVSAQKVGIAEPQTAPTACPDGFQFNDFTSTHASWTAAGTAGGPSDVTRTTETAGLVFKDPASVSPATKLRYSVQVGTKQYQIGETVTFSTGPVLTEVEDVFPPLNGGTAITIQAIYYFSGSTGRCLIVPSQIPAGGVGIPLTIQGSPTTTLPSQPAQLALVRRGSLIQVGSEIVFVLNSTVGPQHQLVLEVSTTGTHVAGETIIGIAAIGVSGISTAAGQTVSAAQINSTIAKGIGTLSQTLGTNPFNLSLGTIGVPQEDDLLHISFTSDLPGNITELKIIFDIDDGSFTKNILYFAVSTSILQQAVLNNVTQLTAAGQLANPSVVYQTLVNSGAGTGFGGRSLGGNASSVFLELQNGTAQLVYDPASGQAQVQSPQGIFTLNLPVGTGVGQYTEVTVSLGSLIRVGNDQTNTLANCTAVQILANVTASTVLGFGSIWVGGGGQLDVGDAGSPYFYRVVPYSVTTGATGNPSPEIRYGVQPRLQPVIVGLPSALYDPQITTWDIERYGGTVNSWRYVGSAPASATTFVDNILDSAALAGDATEFDNFEPWPTVDQPWTAVAGSGGITGIRVIGTAIVVTGTAFPTTILRWLPGTLITLDGQVTYTLYTRPVALAGAVLFRTIENAGNPTVTTLFVNEPNVAAQPLPFLFGPDANGAVFGVGDPLRPGVLYSSKNSNPDSTPNNVYDFTPTSEPAMGGEVIDGLALVATSKRWFEIQQAFSTPNRWNLVETPAGRGLAAPYGHCTDGKYVYFWAKDCIARMVPGTPAISLTDDDLGNLFPHDGVPGKNVTYSIYTFYAPDYGQAAKFRLSIINSILRAHYYDSDGAARLLELDMQPDSTGQPRMAWSANFGPAALTTSFQPAQPPGATDTTGTAYSQCYFADSTGNVYIQQDLSNDNGIAISCALAPPEWDVSDARTEKQWMDAWLDVLPAAPNGILVTPTSGGNAVGTSSSIPQSNMRSQTLSPLGEPIANYLSPVLSWTDDFTRQSVPTQIFEWSLELVQQPLKIRTWKSVPTSHGLQGYQFIYRIRFAYSTRGTNPVTLTITAFDGTSPAVITMPGTSGQYQKTEFVPTFNKGLLFTYEATSTGDWAPIIEDCEVLVGAWDRTTPCAVFNGLGGIES